jgi:hypothetical protein
MEENNKKYNLEFSKEKIIIYKYLPINLVDIPGVLIYIFKILTLVGFNFLI